jgi:predicted lactoylglutathione lyase
MDSLSPNIFVNDINATISFYQQLGFKLIVTVPETGTDLVWAMMVNGGVIIMFQTYTSLGNDLPDISRQDGG